MRQRPRVGCVLRPAAVITEAELHGALKPRCRIFEGTSGSTGISIAMVAKAKCVCPLHISCFFAEDGVRGYEASEPERCRAKSARLTLHTAIVMPDDTAVEKMRSVEAFGATVERVRPAGIVDKRQVRRTHPMTWR